MTTRFTQLAEGFFVAPQIFVEDVKAAADMGVKLVINNRPDGEEAGQPAGAEIETAAAAAGIAYLAIPVGAMGINENMLNAFAEAVAAAEGPVLAYCRSGTRSTVLRAVAGAKAGRSIDEIIAEAANAGYDISGQRGLLEAVKAG